MHATTSRECWTERRLAADERPKVRYDYWVTGRGEFPFDMLRFDHCWPVTGDDAAKLNVYYFQNDVGERLKQRSIRIASFREPTVDRWSSFGWSCSDVKLP